MTVLRRCPILKYLWTRCDLPEIDKPLVRFIFFAREDFSGSMGSCERMDGKNADRMTQAVIRAVEDKLSVLSLSELESFLKYAVFRS